MNFHRPEIAAYLLAMLAHEFGPDGWPATVSWRRMWFEKAGLIDDAFKRAYPQKAIHSIGDKLQLQWELEQMVKLNLLDLEARV